MYKMQYFIVVPNLRKSPSPGDSPPPVPFKLHFLSPKMAWFVHMRFFKLILAKSNF